MGSFSIWHWLLVLLIIILIFGTKKLKDIGKDLGEAVRNFKREVDPNKKVQDKGDAKNNSISKTSESLGDKTDDS